MVRYGFNPTCPHVGHRVIGDQVAYATDGSGTGNSSLSDSDDPPTETSEAVPELLAACMSALDDYEARGNRCWCGDMHDDSGIEACAICKLEAAIAKAKGGDAQ